MGAPMGVAMGVRLVAPMVAPMVVPRVLARELILVLLIPLLVSSILRIISSRRGLPGGVGGARNLANSMVCRYPPRSGGASLEGWEGHETM